MSDPDNPNAAQRATPQWSHAQRDMFWAPNEGAFPPFNTDPVKVKRLAEERLSSSGRLYVACNAGLGWTHHANRAAFYRHQIVPRTLVDTNERDTLTYLFDRPVSAPVGLAPIGLNRIYHSAGETAPAKIARELGLPYVLSSAASCSIEDVAHANGADEPTGGGGLRFFQLYMSARDDEVVRSMLRRAHDAGFAACILTTDTWQLGWRHDDVHAANYAFYHDDHGAGDLALDDPVFSARLDEAGIDPASRPRAAGVKWVDEHIWHGRAQTWEKAAWAMREWREITGGEDKPFVLKGIQSVADAKRAVDMGVDGIIVSNHAGRQVDGAVASLDALERIVDAVGDKTTVMFDSGVRGASDIFKAVALGAKFVFVGRLWVWGLSIQGEIGVRHVLRSLLGELDILMNVAGYPRVEDITRDAIESLPPGTGVPPGVDLT